MNIEVNRKLKPLYANLLRVNLPTYLITERFNHLMLENDWEQIWADCRKIVSQQSNVIMLIPGYTGDAEKAFGIFLNHVYNNTSPKEGFYIIIKLILKDFLEWSDQEIDPTNILNSIQNIGIEKEKFNDIFGEIFQKIIHKEESNLEFKYNYDLNYYFNASNIGNQNLVFETYNYFEDGDGCKLLRPLDFLNILYWHYEYLTKNIDKPFDILNRFKSSTTSEKERHLLIGFILKWFGGYPVSNLNTQYYTVLKLLEREYLNYLQIRLDKKQKIINGLLHATSLRQYSNNVKSDKVPYKHNVKLGKNNIPVKLEKEIFFLERFDKLVKTNKTEDRFKKRELGITDSLNVASVKNEVAKKDLNIFISHSSKDEELVKLFVDRILLLSLKINLDCIFCTSIEACSITSGEDFRDIIKERLIKASHVIQIITENYKHSEVCLNEMGAAWVLNNRIFPFIMEPIDYESVGFIHLPNQLLKLNNAKDILRFIDEIKLIDSNLKHTEVNRHVNDFIKNVVK